jgi:hypothetical protein
MNVAAEHAEYSINAPYWRRMRDVVAGEDAIKAGGNLYVAKLDSQSEEEYKAYVSRSFFYGATARTLDGYLGLIFRKSPQFVFAGGDSSASKTWSSFKDDSDLLGTSLPAYCRNVVSDVLTVGRGGTLVDWHDGEQRAALTYYRAENIINWRETRVNGKSVLTLLVLREYLTVTDPKDPFTDKTIEQLRAYILDDAGCRVEVWQEVLVEGDKERTEWVRISVAQPQRLGKMLMFIPFVFHGPKHARPQIQRSPLADVAIANIAHYRVDVDFKHGLHYTALPTAWVCGFDKQTEFKIGSTTAWVSDQIGATAGFLEFTGQGLGSFEKAMDRLERLLSVLGARLLESQKRVSESAEALSIRQGGEHSIISDVADSISVGLTNVLRMVFWWHSSVVSPEAVTAQQALIELNTDYDVAKLSASDIVALVYAWQQGAMSRDTLHYRMERGEMLPPGRTLEEELAKIAQHPPPAPPVGSNGAPVRQNPPLII